MDDSKQNLLTVREVAGVLRLSKSTVKNYILEGKIESIKFGYKTLRITQGSLDDFIKTHSQDLIRNQDLIKE